MMEIISNLVFFFLHLDKYLNATIQDYGIWTYLILFMIIFIETGLFVAPFLPGDSLLFAAGALAAGGSLKVIWLFALLSIAAIIGDTLNYWIGRLIGPKIFSKERKYFLNQKNLRKTRHFYEKYGGKTVVIARFVPIVRTLAPFVAGIGKMDYPRFIGYNIIGGISWPAIFIFGGYYFGNITLVKENFSLVIVAIIILSIMPAVIEFIRGRHQL